MTIAIEFTLRCIKCGMLTNGPTAIQGLPCNLSGCDGVLIIPTVQRPSGVSDDWWLNKSSPILALAGKGFFQMIGEKIKEHTPSDTMRVAINSDSFPLSVSVSVSGAAPNPLAASIATLERIEKRLEVLAADALKNCSPEFQAKHGDEVVHMQRAGAEASPTWCGAAFNQKFDRPLWSDVTCRECMLACMADWQERYFAATRTVQVKAATFCRKCGRVTEPFGGACLKCIEVKSKAVDPNETFLTRTRGKVYVPLCRADDGEQIYAGPDGRYYRIGEDMEPVPMVLVGGGGSVFIPDDSRHDTPHITDDPPPRFGRIAAILCGVLGGGILGPLLWLLFN